MIKIGLNTEQKKQSILDYLDRNPEITNIVHFRPDGWDAPDLSDTGMEVEYRTWNDAIMYKYFYPLLEKIDGKTLIVFDEMMRTKKRNDLTYNCCHHYGNQTPHIIVFNHLPVIDEAEDFMILVDYAFPNRYKGISFDASVLSLAEIVPVLPETDDIEISSEDKIRMYEEKRDALFDGLGQKDPDTIPRELHMWAGTNCKKTMIGSDGNYIARNGRFKKPNVFTYKDFPNGDEFSIIDFPVRQLNFNDFLLKSGASRIHFLNSGLPVDRYYYGTLQEWEEMIKGVFYETPGIPA